MSVPTRHFRFPDIVRHTLSNGLDVRTVEHRSMPVVTMVLQVEGGSGADAAGQEGLAAITADMVDEGTGSLSAIDVSDALARIGAEYDVDVGPDVTTFSLARCSASPGAAPRCWRICWFVPVCATRISSASAGCASIGCVS